MLLVLRLRNSAVVFLGNTLFIFLLLVSSINSLSFASVVIAYALFSVAILGYSHFLETTPDTVYELTGKNLNLAKILCVLGSSPDFLA